MRAFLPARWDMFGCFWNALFPNHIHITSEESGTVADTARSALDIYIYIYIYRYWQGTGKHHAATVCVLIIFQAFSEDSCISFPFLSYSFPLLSFSFRFFSSLLLTFLFAALLFSSLIFVFYTPHSSQKPPKILPKPPKMSTWGASVTLLGIHGAWDPTFSPILSILGGIWSPLASNFAAFCSLFKVYFPTSF